MWERTSARMRLTSVRTWAISGRSSVVRQPLEPVDAEAQGDQLLGDAVVDLASETFALLDPRPLPQPAEGEGDGDEPLVLAGHGRRGREQLGRRNRGTHSVADDDAVLPLAGVAQRDRELHPAVVEDDHAGATVVPRVADDPMVVARVGPGNAERASQGQRNGAVGRRADQHPRPRPRTRAGQRVEDVLGGRRGIEPRPHLGGQALEARQEPGWPRPPRRRPWSGVERGGPTRRPRRPGRR